jgi:predicted ATPase
VVEEAATGVITRQQRSGVAEPWAQPDFIQRVLALQQQRQASSPAKTVQVFDRSPLCTLALARYLDVPVPRALSVELDRLVEEQFYVPRALFVRPLGFVEKTAVRRISYQESLAFEALHESTYREYGFTMVDIPAASVAERVGTVVSILQQGPFGGVNGEGFRQP